MAIYRDTVLEALAQVFSLAPKDPPPFPSLRSVSWCDKETQQHRLKEVFLAAPGLLDVEIPWGSETAAEADRIMSILAKAAESLQSLHIHYASEQRDRGIYCSEALSTTLSGFQSLTKFQFEFESCFDGSNLSNANKILDAAAQLPGLKRLELCYPPPSVQGARRQEFLFDTFVALRFLRIDHGTGSGCKELFRRYQFPALVDLAIVPNFSESSSLAELIAAIASSCHPHTLASITIKPHVDIMTQTILFPHGILRPLLGFSKIEKLVVDDPKCALLDDTEIDLISSAWPALRVLSVHDAAPRLAALNKDIKVTMRGLQTLLERCPRLEELGLVLEATVDLLPEKPALPLNKRVTALELSNSPIIDPRRVARVLATMLPRLNVIHHQPMFNIGVSPMASGIAGKKIFQRWTETEKMIRELRNVSVKQEATVKQEAGSQ